MKKIAVAGAGLSGLAFCYYYLSLHPENSVTLFDPKPAPDNTSSLALLLHPFGGRRTICNRFGKEGLQETLSLLHKASSYAEKPLFTQKSLLKLAIDPESHHYLRQACLHYPDRIRWLEKTEYGYPGALISESYQVEAVEYLQALLRLAIKKGCSFIQEPFSTSSAPSFDAVILATGHALSETPFAGHFSSKIKGQLLKVKSSHVPDRIISAPKIQIIPCADSSYCYLGSTYERSYETELPCRETAEKLLFPAARKIGFSFLSSDVVDIYAGFRLHTPDRLPFSRQEGENLRILSAMGSKGLLYHAYFAKKLAEDIILPSTPGHTR